MSYSIKAFHRATGLFYAYVHVGNRSQWKTRPAAAAQARGFAKANPQYVCALVDADTDETLSVITGYSYSRDKGLHLYTDASSLMIPTQSHKALAESMGLPCVHLTEFLGLQLADIIKAHSKIIAKDAA